MGSKVTLPKGNSQRDGLQTKAQIKARGHEWGGLGGEKVGPKAWRAQTTPWS